ncbi:MAG: hypothetical protein R3F43_00950 [bacterium]
MSALLAAGPWACDQQSSDAGPDAGLGAGGAGGGGGPGGAGGGPGGAGGGAGARAEAPGARAAASRSAPIPAASRCGASTAASSTTRCGISPARPRARGDRCCPMTTSAMASTTSAMC